MTKLVVLSSGFVKREPYLDELFSDLCQNKKVLIIANAANINSGNFVNRETVKKNLLEVGAVSVDIVNLNIVTISTLPKYEVVYIMGGQLKDLVRAVSEVNFRDVLLKFMEQGVVVAESEGAVVLAEDFKYYYDLHRGVDLRALSEPESYAGLGFIKYKFFPHFNKQSDIQKQKIVEYNQEHENGQVTRLSDGDYVLFDDLEKDEELTLALDAEGQSTHRFEIKEKIKQEGLCFNIVGLWIINSKGQVLMQKRAATKKYNPNKWAICAGHVQAEETLVDAMKREAQEEVGLKLKDEQLINLIYGKRNNRFYKGFYTFCNNDIKTFKIQESEVSEIAWVNFEDVRKAYKKQDGVYVFEKSEFYDELFKKLARVIKKFTV